jgi:hypothetical protein
MSTGVARVVLEARCERTARAIEECRHRPCKMTHPMAPAAID